MVFKGDISKFSDCLAVGLTTGYLGSLTTFSGWNQRMLELSVEGKWVVVFGIPLGNGRYLYLFILVNQTLNLASCQTVQFYSLRSLTGKGKCDPKAFPILK